MCGEGGTGDAIRWVLSNPFKARALKTKWALRDANNAKEKAELIVRLLKNHLECVQDDSDEARFVRITIYDQEVILKNAQEELSLCMLRWNLLAACEACEGEGKAKGEVCTVCRGTGKTAGSPKD